MQQKELADLLGVSPAMVSRHAKRGMPTDSLERAQRWRRRHLEPGRVKGARAFSARPPLPTRQGSSPDTENGVSLGDVQAVGAWLDGIQPQHVVSDAEIEAAGALVDDCLTRGNQYGAVIRTWQLRALLRQTDNDASPRLSLRVWLALSDFWLGADAKIRHARNMGELLTPGEFGARVGDGSTPAGVMLFEACDFDDNAINGYPEYPDDPEWVQWMAEDRAEKRKLRCSRVFGCEGYPLPPEWAALMAEH